MVCQAYLTGHSFFLPAFRGKGVSAEGIVQEGRENGTAVYQGRKKSGGACEDTLY